MEAVQGLEEDPPEKKGKCKVPDSRKLRRLRQGHIRDLWEQLFRELGGGVRDRVRSRVAQSVYHLPEGALLRCPRS